MTNHILSIAGSDPSTLAGVQGDIKTALKLETDISTVITSIIAQNSFEVDKVENCSKEIIKSQIETILKDSNFRTIKIGMVGSNSKEIAKTLKEKTKNIPIILDPVIISSSGKELLEKSEIADFKDFLIPICHLITPNVKEAEILANIEIKTLKDIKKSARIIQNLGVKNVLITGGDFDDSNKEIFHLLLTQENEEIIITNNRLPFKNIRGTGCRLSTAIACFLSQDQDLVTAIKNANNFVYESIKNGKQMQKAFVMNYINSHF